VGAVEAVGELGAAPGQELHARRSVEEAAERELEREEALIVAGVVGGEQLDELLVAARRDRYALRGRRPVGLGRSRMRAAAASPFSEPVGGIGRELVAVVSVGSPVTTSMASARSSRRSAGYSEPNETPQKDPSISLRRFFNS